MNNKEVIEELINIQSKPVGCRHELKQSNALQHAIDILERIDRIEGSGIVEKEKEIPIPTPSVCEAAYGDSPVSEEKSNAVGYNAHRQETIARILKNWPTVSKVAFALKDANLPFFGCITKERRAEAYYDTAKVAHALFTRLIEEKRDKNFDDDCYRRTRRLSEAFCQCEGCNTRRQEIILRIFDNWPTVEEVEKIIVDTQNTLVHCALDGMMAIDFMKKKISKAVHALFTKLIEEGER